MCVFEAWNFADLGVPPGGCSTVSNKAAIKWCPNEFPKPPKFRIDLKQWRTAQNRPTKPEQRRTVQNSSEPPATARNHPEQLRTAQRSPEQTRAIQNNSEQSKTAQNSASWQESRTTETNPTGEFVVVGVALQKDLLLDQNSVQTTKAFRTACDQFSIRVDVYRQDHSRICIYIYMYIR